MSAISIHLFTIIGVIILNVILEFTDIFRIQ